MGLYHRPASIDAALAAIAERSWTLIAGATDHYPSRGDRLPDEDILDLSRVISPAITSRPDHWHIPCTTTWSDLIAADLPPQFDALKQAAAQVGGRQVQNVGTIIGNLCNASPAADGIPCLLALDATVEIAGPHGARRRPVADFLLGPRKTALQHGELVTGLAIPASPARANFQKLGARRFLVISIAMVALNAEFDPQGRIATARLAIGACGPVAIRLPEVEAALIGHLPDPTRLRPADFAALSPIDDIRAPASYRRAAVLELARRAVAALA